MSSFGLFSCLFVCESRTRLTRFCAARLAEPTAHSPIHSSLSTQPCRISAPKPGTTSSSSTLHMTPLAASPHSLLATQCKEERVVRRWHRNGSAASLERRAASGKAPVLSRAQVSCHVRAPILAANRAHRAIHYTELLPAVRQKTGLFSGNLGVRCSATARRSWEAETNKARREQQMRVSATTHA